MHIVFTGIIESMAKVRSPEEGRLTLERPKSFTDVRIGSSVAVAGTCLTIVALDDATMTFEVVTETLRKTTLGSVNAGSIVNLERAMPANGRFEGHILQGHVEGIAEVVSICDEKMGKMITIVLPEDLVTFVVSKGSIALDGVSLTVAKIEDQHCSVAVIPHTLVHTTLGTLREGGEVNVETDVIGRYCASLIRTSHSSL